MIGRTAFNRGRSWIPSLTAVCVFIVTSSCGPAPSATQGSLGATSASNGEPVEGRSPVASHPAPAHDAAGDLTKDNDRSKLRRMRVKIWVPSSKVVTALALTSEQVEQIAANEEEFADKMFAARDAEQRSSLRLIRNLGRDPVPSDLIVALEKKLFDASQVRISVETERIRNLRTILNQTQWIRLLELDTTAVRIGSFQPHPVIRVNVTDTDIDGDPAGEQAAVTSATPVR